MASRLLGGFARNVLGGFAFTGGSACTVLGGFALQRARRLRGNVLGGFALQRARRLRCNVLGGFAPNVLGVKLQGMFGGFVTEHPAA